ncbi:hypothetical protein APT_01605 [Acetobacter pasteurianus NBRC 101655]|nr:hypothetical protein APT_01605 [Acetobacter pasteurianus NBRC 101655]
MSSFLQFNSVDRIDHSIVLFFDNRHADAPRSLVLPIDVLDNDSFPSRSISFNICLGSCFGFLDPIINITGLSLSTL